MSTSEEQGESREGADTPTPWRALAALLIAAAFQTAPASAIVYVMPTDEGPLGTLFSRGPLMGVVPRVERVEN